MILEPLKRRAKHESTGTTTDNPHDFASREEIGSGLHVRHNLDERSGPTSQKSQRMRQTEYMRGFKTNLDLDAANAEIDPLKVLR